MRCAALSNLKEVGQAISPGWDFLRLIPQVFVARLPLSELSDSEIISILNGKKTLSKKSDSSHQIKFDFLHEEIRVVLHLDALPGAFRADQAWLLSSLTPPRCRAA